MTQAWEYRLTMRSASTEEGVLGRGTEGNQRRLSQQAGSGAFNDVEHRLTVSKSDDDELSS